MIFFFPLVDVYGIILFYFIFFEKIENIQLNLYCKDGYESFFNRCISYASRFLRCGIRPKFLGFYSVRFLFLNFE